MSKDRIILHVDMNNFYASVESLTNPEFKNVPMAVAGDPKKRHGIILAKNELAKKAGVSTGEAIWLSKQKCPNLVLCEPHYEKYHHYSKNAFEIYSRYTDQVEPYGLDECWLDVTGSQQLFGNGRQIAEKIMSDIRNELGLTVSVGVSFNKVFAKLGSDLKKPDAMTEITRENYKDIVWTLPASDLLFVGKSTKKTLLTYGINTIGDLAKSNPKLLSLGKIGTQLWSYANGLDDSKVQSTNFHHEMKSISNSTTTDHDMTNDEDIKKVLYNLSEKVAHRLRKHGFWANALHLSIRKSNLEQYQKSVTLKFSVCDSENIFNESYKMLKSCKEYLSIRSLGISAEKLTHEGVFQVSFFGEDTSDKILKLEETKDKLRQKYGVATIQRAILIKNEDNSINNHH